MNNLFEGYTPLPDNMGHFSVSAFDYLRVYDFSLFMQGLPHDNRRKFIKAIMLECFIRTAKTGKKVTTPVLFRIFDEIEYAKKELLTVI